MASAGVLPLFEFNATYIHALKQGDPSTQEHFVSHFSPILMRKLRKKLSCTDTIYDARQETFLRVLTILQSEEGVRRPERFEVLVLGVCNNVVREVYRHKKRIVPLEPEFDAASHAPGPDMYMAADAAGIEVQKLLARLGHKARAVLEAAFLEEQDREEICLRFGISRNHLRLLIHRAKKTLGANAKQQPAVKPALQVHRMRKVTTRPFKVPVHVPALIKKQEAYSVPVFLPALNPTVAARRQILATG